MNSLMQNGRALIILLVISLIAIWSTVVVVPETKQAVIVRFGDPVRIVNRFKPNETFGASGAGVVLRIPFAEQVVWVDKRVLDIEMEQQQVLSTDQLRLEVDAFARFRIVDPQRMYVAAGSEERVAEELRSILGSDLRNELGKRPFAALLTPERGAVMDLVQARLNLSARKYGAEVIDVQIKRADLPRGTPLESAFQRMRTARQQQAQTITAEGQKNAQIIRAEAEAAAARTYAEAFGKDPEFYDFYRAMQSYEQTFLNGKADTSVILSPDNEYLRQFRGR